MVTTYSACKHTWYPKKIEFTGDTNKDYYCSKCGMRKRLVTGGTGWTTTEYLYTVADICDTGSSKSCYYSP